jgi:hypothetical protein
LAFLAARCGRPILAFTAQHVHPGLLIVVGWLRPGVAILFVIFAGKDNSIAPYKASKGAISFMDCDLVNFDQSFFHNTLILKDGRLLFVRKNFYTVREMNGPCLP